MLGVEFILFLHNVCILLIMFKIPFTLKALLFALRVFILWKRGHAFHSQGMHSVLKF